MGVARTGAEGVVDQAGRGRNDNGRGGTAYRDNWTKPLVSNAASHRHQQAGN